MKSTITFGALLCGALLMAGCADQATITKLEQTVTKLETDLASTQSELSILKEGFEALRQANVDKEIMASFEKVAYLTPGSDGYSVVSSDIGPITVSIANVTAYANGSKVTLQFGNMHAGVIDGLKASVDWGSVDKNGIPINEESKSREVRFKESLRAGAWTKSDVILEGVDPKDLGFVRLSKVGHIGIKLNTR